MSFARWQQEQVAALLRRALDDAERGIPDPPPVDDEVIEFLAVPVRRGRPRRL